VNVLLKRKETAALITGPKGPPGRKIKKEPERGVLGSGVCGGGEALDTGKVHEVQKRKKELEGIEVVGVAGGTPTVCKVLLSGQ